VIEIAPWRRRVRECGAFELRRSAQHGKDKLGKVRGRIDNRLGNRTQARSGSLQSRAITNRSVAPRESRSTAGVMTTSPGARAFMSF
jgi:hypothetical protein